MSLQAIELTDATAQQRLDYATTTLNLDTDEAESDEQIISLIRTAQPGNSKIFVEVSEGPTEQDKAGDIAPPVTGNRIAGSKGKRDPMATIFIPKTEMPMGADDVAVGVNGVVWQLKRGFDLPVPWRVVVALGYTEQDLVTHTETGDVVVNKSQRIPFTFAADGHPDKADIEEWFKNTNEAFCP